MQSPKNNSIDKLKSLFIRNDIDGYIIPSNDEFQSEYVIDENNRLKYVTGFGGSNGIAIITNDNNYFFTDGRYIVEAKKNLHNFEVFNISALNQFSYSGRLGFDPKLFSISNFAKFGHLNLIACEYNLVDQIWSRETKANHKVYNYPEKYAGLSVDKKILMLKEFLQKYDGDAILITDPANISWLLNLRSTYDLMNPVLLANLIFYKTGEIKVFCNESLSRSSYEIYPFNHLERYLHELKEKKVILDPRTASIWHRAILKEASFCEDPVYIAKAIKNNIEQAQAKRINLIDSVALNKFLFWLDSEKNDFYELDVVNKLYELRSEHEDFIAPSFHSICGFKGNGAIIHYRANEKTNLKIQGDGLLLVDSGGHYWGGTTDVTRVALIGKATYEQKRDYTDVLKGHIAIASAKIPLGATGKDLDPLARQFLWKRSKDYSHGTGHGVGNMLNVHEGPQSISRYSNVCFQPGMIVSNEPGFYKENEYGIRLESLLLTEQEGDFLSFKALTLVPFEKKLILFELLSKQEKQWLKSYHDEVFKKISPSLNSKQQAWLKRKTTSPL